MFIQKILCRISGVCVGADDSVRPHRMQRFLAGIYGEIVCTCHFECRGRCGHRPLQLRGQLHTNAPEISIKTAASRRVDGAIRPYQLRLILAVGALRLWNLPKHPAHAEAAQEVQLFSARFFRVEQQNACVTRLVPKKAVAAGKIFREVRRIPRDQCVRCGFVKRHSDTRETGNGKQHTDGRKIHPKSAAPDREQSAQVSFQTAAGNLRVAPDGRGIWHCCLNRLQQPCVATARRFAEQISAVKFRRRHSARREQVQLTTNYAD